MPQQMPAHSERRRAPRKHNIVEHALSPALPQVGQRSGGSGAAALDLHRKKPVLLASNQVTYDFIADATSRHIGALSL
jgi:hypothetical protein